MRISDWSSDVCSSDLTLTRPLRAETAPMHLESMEMIIFPTKRDLDYPVQTKKRQIAANQQASPNHRRYIPEADLQTVSDKRSRIRHAPQATGSAQNGRASCGERVGTSV